MSIAVTPTDLTNAATTLRNRAAAVQELPRGHGVVARGDLLGSLDDSHRCLVDQLHDLRRWIDTLASSLDHGAADYEATENALTADHTSANADGS